MIFIMYMFYVIKVLFYINNKFRFGGVVYEFILVLRYVIYVVIMCIYKYSEF